MNLPLPYDPDFAAAQRRYTPFGRLLEKLAAGQDVVMEVVADTTWIDGEIVSPITGRSMYYDRQGHPISMTRWGELRETGLDPDGHYGAHSYLRIGEDRVGEATVSTVWLGIDHGWSGMSFPGDPEYRPVIFETMIFGGVHDHMMMHYHTEDEARKGHAEAVADLRAGMEPWWAYGGVEDDEWRCAP